MSELPESEVVAAIKTVVDILKATTWTVNLKHHYFDRVPCSRSRLYTLCRKYATVWGCEYHKQEYVPSGNRPFQRNHKRGQIHGPYLYFRSKQA